MHDEILTGANPAGDARLIADILTAVALHDPDPCPACGELREAGEDCFSCEGDA